MESLKQRPGLQARSQLQKLRQRPWCIALAVSIAVVIILVIVIPLAILLPRRGNGGKLSSTVLFPLYIYPETNTTWDPLYTALTNYPELNFVVIVNPASGPGPSPLPDDQYQVAIRRLSTFPNVQKVGYVRTGYATRNQSAVMEDVATYAGWASHAPALAMEGIFFDESPHEYVSGLPQYMSEVNQAAKAAEGLANHLVIHNPGTIPDSRYDDPSTDVTVMFEQSYSMYQTRMAQKLSSLPDSSSNRASYAYMFHSVELSGSDFSSLVDDLSEQAEYLFLTSLTEGFYESFDPRLEEFCAAVPV